MQRPELIIIGGDKEYLLKKIDLSLYDHLGITLTQEQLFCDKHIAVEIVKDEMYSFLSLQRDIVYEGLDRWIVSVAQKAQKLGYRVSSYFAFRRSYFSSESSSARKVYFDLLSSLIDLSDRAKIYNTSEDSIYLLIKDSKGEIFPPIYQGDVKNLAVPYLKVPTSNDNGRRFISNALSNMRE